MINLDHVRCLKQTEACSARGSTLVVLLRIIGLPAIYHQPVPQVRCLEPSVTPIAHPNTRQHARIRPSTKSDFRNAEKFGRFTHRQNWIIIDHRIQH